MKKKYYIGLATTFHDPAVAIVNDEGEIVFAEATERRLQYKRAFNCPPDQLNYVGDLLNRYCSDASEFVVATSWSKGFFRSLKTASLLGRYRFDSIRNHGGERDRFVMPLFYLPAFSSFMNQSQFAAGLGSLVDVNRIFGHLNVSLRRYDHHQTHAVHACRTSPFEEALCLVVDGYGEYGSMAAYNFDHGRLRSLKRHRGIASLGLFYGFLTELCGFSFLRGEEWKVMGLASYGRLDTGVYELLCELIRADRGLLKVPRPWNKRKLMNRLWSLRSNVEEDFDMSANIAYSGQLVYSETMDSMLADYRRDAGSVNLVLCGGCALNSAYNGGILANSGFERLYVPAAPADDGNAVGAALMAFLQDCGSREYRPGQHSDRYPYLGSGLAKNSVEKICRNLSGLRINKPGDDLYSEVAALLAQGKVIGWARGPAEFGPRALGNRSILADPRNPGIRDRINREIKFREDFRPLAPAVLTEYGDEYFEDYQYSPHMERVLRVRKDLQNRVPAIVHVDGSSRVQSVSTDSNPSFYRLLREFHAVSGVPMLLNTSLNIMGKPIAHSVEDLVGTFLSTGLDILVVEDVIIEK